MTGKQPVKKRAWQTVIIWSILIIAVYVIVLQLLNRGGKAVDIPYSIFLRELRQDNVSEVTITEKSIRGKFNTSISYQDRGNFSEFTTLIPFEDPRLADELVKHNVEVVAKQKSGWGNIVINIVPWLLLIGVWIFFIRQMQSGQNKALGFGRSRAKVILENKPSVTFKDVAGVEEAKQELQEVIEFLKEPRKFTRLGGRIPKGVLLLGPPGTGKTLMARAVAGEARVPFMSISGSNFVEMFVGVGASRVRDLFDQAKRNSPCIIFIDEIDAVGRLRGAGLGGGHDEREQTLNQLLVEMDGFEVNEGIILMAATNRPDILDPALLRPGRFDRVVVLDRPDVRGRMGILKVHTRKKPLAEDVDLDVLARGTPGFSGADLANMVNEAALLAARRNKENITMAEFEDAKDKILMGVERKSLLISDDEKKLTAYHECGHVLVAKSLPGMDPIHKVTIIPRGMSLGVTQALPIDERRTYSKSYCKNQLAFMLGGRAAEKIVLGDLSTGAGNDIEKATKLARKMVCEWGMSDRLGPLTYGEKQEEIFLGREIGMHRDYSEDTAREIDEEIKKIIEEAEHRAEQIIKKNLKKLKKLAGTLLEKEILTSEEIDKILGVKRAEKRAKKKSRS
ncbi:MAG TPA: ATP-dependent metallopeptidase FtsH/Yme1/Tma family protein [candidate division WOR-3 bacterium]|uniref:ATP-dependent zinc metalloprotease FtsH n=1 Tax=candidate division WOR-3 bacterium TaxID=2052148 RepID=A0A9C9ENF0_UNCW3|nr:ATP-dependent metallopeptidase FtsH/Yme1/Tma family protein [candidate division WOR-3 bacterium]